MHLKLLARKIRYNKIALALLVVFLSSVLMPFHYVYANDSLTAPFIGYNWKVIDYSYDREYQYTLNYNESSSGTGTFQMTSGSVTVSGPTQYGNYTLYSSANQGGQMNMSGTITIPSSSSSASLSNTTVNVQYQVIEYEVILDNDYQGVVNMSVNGSTTDHYVNGNSIVGSITRSGSFNTNGNSNIVIEINSFTLIYSGTKMQWQFPVESFPSIIYLFNQGFDQVGINQYSDYMYPLFNSVTGVDIYNNIAANNGTILVMLIPSNISSIALFNNNFTYNSNLYVDSITTLFVSSGNRFCQVIFKKYDNSISTPMHLQWTQADKKFCIIYGNNVQASNIYPVSLEFGLTFGLNNRLLNDISIIANGTTNSNNSVSNSDQLNSSLQDTFSDEEELVSDAETDLAGNLEDLDIENQNNSLFGNSKFIGTASWVRDRFDYLTDDNPFGYIITFSLVIGLSLVIIGKLRG